MHQKGSTLSQAAELGEFDSTVNFRHGLARDVGEQQSATALEGEGHTQRYRPVPSIEMSAEESVQLRIIGRHSHLLDILDVSKHHAHGGYAECGDIA
jgi:hypothetical protein